MKKYAPYVILFLFAAMLWNLFTWSGDMTVNLDGDQIDGPLGFLLATLFTGGGMLLAMFISVITVAVLAVVFAGVGVILIGSLAIGALVLALAMSPLLLPLVVVVALSAHRRRLSGLVSDYFSQSPAAVACGLFHGAGFLYDRGFGRASAEDTDP